MSTRKAALRGVLVLASLTAGAAACSGDKSVTDVGAGDCIESLAALGSTNITDLPVVDCTEDHEAEVLKIFTHTEDGDFPGNETLQSEADADCTGQPFEDYTGTAYSDSAILVAELTPTEDSWSHGDRETICVMHTGGDTVDESFRDNGDDFPLGG